MFKISHFGIYFEPHYQKYHLKWLYYKFVFTLLKFNTLFLSFSLQLCSCTKARWKIDFISLPTSMLLLFAEVSARKEQSRIKFLKRFCICAESIKNHITTTTTTTFLYCNENIRASPNPTKISRKP